jgi:hypothetical protein
MYQDQWLNGALAKAGTRECAARYEIVRDFVAARYGNAPRLSVCDFGASHCYFSLRLAEDFPKCRVIAFEYRNVELREAWLAANKAERVTLIGKKLSLADVRNLGACARFDVVLALSVMHHLPGPFGPWLDAIRALGSFVVAEFALDDSARVARCSGYRVPADAVTLGSGKSHLSADIERPIAYFRGRPNA